MGDKFYIFESILLIAQKWQDKADRVVEERMGITMRQWMLIMVIQEEFRDHLPTISETAERFGTSRQNIKRLSVELQKKGFILLATDPEDHRILRIALTGKHRGFIEGEENIRWQKEFIDQFFDRIDQEELKFLQTSIYKIMKEIV